MSNFVWASKKTNDEIATLSGNNITLNKSASSYFELAYSVLLGLSEQDKLIAIRPLTKEEAVLGHVPEEQKHNITVKSSYSRICNKNFMEEVASLIGVSFQDNKTYKYHAYWSPKEGALIIDLSKMEE